MAAGPWDQGVWRDVLARRWVRGKISSFCGEGGDEVDSSSSAWPELSLVFGRQAAAHPSAQLCKVPRCKPHGLNEPRPNDRGPTGPERLWPHADLEQRRRLAGARDGSMMTRLALALQGRQGGSVNGPPSSLPRGDRGGTAPFFFSVPAFFTGQKAGLRQYCETLRRTRQGLKFGVFFELCLTCTT